MNENTPRCRLCGYQLKAQAGCVECTPIKRNLIWPAIEDAASDVSATAVINSTLRALKARMKRIERELKVEGDEYNPVLTKDLTSIGRTLKELAGEQRKLEDREEQRYQGLGIEGRMNLFVEQFFSLLPEDHQIKLLQSMRACFEKQSVPLLNE